MTTPWEKSPAGGKRKPSTSLARKVPRQRTAAAKIVPGDDVVFQLKITLHDSFPPIWRRIQVRDCTLDKLHEHIQTAMGWTNSHLHHFIVRKQYYGAPDLMQDNFDELGYADSTVTKLIDIVPTTNRKFRFLYEYDFGDSWYHIIEFERRVPANPNVSYPVCLDGARACPPEDVGGVWSYPGFLDALSNPRHKRHAELLEWIGGRFDSEAFDPIAATRKMHRGLPGWR